MVQQAIREQIYSWETPHFIFAYILEWLEWRRINRSQLNRYENGQNARLGSLFRLLSKIGITPPDFFADGFDWSEFFSEED